MEVVLSLGNFSYYTSSETFYIKGTVLIKKNIEGDTNQSPAFGEIKKGSKVNLRFRHSDHQKVSLLLTEKIIRVRSLEIVKPTDPSRGITFVAESIAKCEI